MIGYYAHYHGYGHSNYANQLLKEIPESLTIFSSSDFNFSDSRKVILVPNEELDGSEYAMDKFSTPDYLHCAPINSKKIISRSATILNTIVERNIKMLLVDVNVEIATLARVSSVPYAYRRMFGKRNDEPHLNAYREACFLMAYYPESLESDETPDWVRNKTYYTGFIAKSFGNTISLNPMSESYILVIQGKGGSKMDKDFFIRLSEYFGSTSIIVLGDVEEKDRFTNIIYKGFVRDITPYIDHAKYIISSCGSNTTSEILSRGKKFLIVPESRPFDEQLEISRLLEKNHLGVCLDIDNISRSIEKIKCLKDDIPTCYHPGNFSEFAKLLVQHDFLADKIQDSIFNSKF